MPGAEQSSEHLGDVERVVVALLDGVVHAAPEGDRHILTSLTANGREVSTAVWPGAGPDAVENPHVLVLIAARIVAGDGDLPLVLRTFHADEVSHTTPSGVDIPVKTVRGWHFDGVTLVPLDEQAMFAAHCTDAATGDPIPPDRDVRYADAWPVSFISE